MTGSESANSVTVFNDANETSTMPRTVLRSHHLLSIGDLDSDEINLIFNTAEAMKEIGSRTIKKVPALRGKTIVNLFYEPSTRTSASFEIAEKRLSADSLNIAVTGSSVVKGETLFDTARNLEAMAPDIIVLRHEASGAPHLLAGICRAGVINAGDGMHEHPTQALLDGFTIRAHKGRIDGLKVVIVGDLLHSRVLRSNILLLRELGADVWTVERGDRAKPDVIIMHPGPINRGVEIASEVADGPYSVMLEQVANGVAVRMAVLYLLAGNPDEM